MTNTSPDGLEFGYKQKLKKILFVIVLKCDNAQVLRHLYFHKKNVQGVGGCHFKFQATKGYLYVRGE